MSSLLSVCQSFRNEQLIQNTYGAFSTIFVENLYIMRVWQQFAKTEY